MRKIFSKFNDAGLRMRKLSYIAVICISVSILVGIKLWRSHHTTKDEINEEVKVLLTDKTSLELANLGPTATIIISDLGLNSAQLKEAMSLPNNFTLGFSPYNDNVVEDIIKASSSGFESLIYLPMQPANYSFNDPGPYALLDNLPAADNVSRLESVLSKSDKLVGLYLSEDEVFTNSKENCNLILKTLKGRGKALLYSDIESSKPLNSIAIQDNNFDVLRIDISLDSELSEEELLNKLYYLEELARSRKKTVGIARAYPLTLKVLREWSENLVDIKLVPVSRAIEINRLILENSNKLPPRE